MSQLQAVKKSPLLKMQPMCTKYGSSLSLDKQLCGIRQQKIFFTICNVSLNCPMHCTCRTDSGIDQRFRSIVFGEGNKHLPFCCQNYPVFILDSSYSYIDVFCIYSLSICNSQYYHIIGFGYGQEKKRSKLPNQHRQGKK